MKIVALRERGSKDVLTTYILNDDEKIPTGAADYAESMGYYLVVHPVNVRVDNTPLAFLASVQEEIEAYEND